MQISLTSIKVLTSMSQETHCYEATLRVNGKVVGTVGNEGMGGPDHQNVPANILTEIAAFFEREHPPVELGEGLGRVPMDLEMWCCEEVNRHLMTKELKTLLKKKVVYQHPVKKGLYTVGFKGVKSVEPRHIHSVKRSHPDAIILNEMPFEEALTLFRADAA